MWVARMRRNASGSLICDTCAPFRNIERRALGVNLDHGPMLVAARRHVRFLERPEGIAFTGHKFG
jgi:hypothetical protein